MSSDLDIQAEQQLHAELQIGLGDPPQPHIGKPVRTLPGTTRSGKALRHLPTIHARPSEYKPMYHELGFMWYVESSKTVRDDLENEIEDSGKYEPGIAPHIAILRRKATALRWFESEGFNTTNMVGDEIEAIERALRVHTPKVNPAYITAAERNLADTDHLCRKYLPRMVMQARRTFGDQSRKRQRSEDDEEARTGNRGGTFYVPVYKSFALGAGDSRKRAIVVSSDEEDDNDEIP